MFKSACIAALLSVTGKIDPQVIEVETVLTKPISQVILANSITLTPGTVTIGIDSERRVLKVAALTPRKDRDIIPFERYIKGMLE